MSCNIGTECQVAAEAVEAVGVLADPEQWEVVARPWGVPGYVAIANIAPSGIDDKRMSTELASTLLELRSILHVMEYHDHDGPLLRRGADSLAACIEPHDAQAPHACEPARHRRHGGAYARLKAHRRPAQAQDADRRSISARQGASRRS